MAKDFVLRYISVVSHENKCSISDYTKRKLPPHITITVQAIQKDSGFSEIRTPRPNYWENKAFKKTAGHLIHNLDSNNNHPHGGGDGYLTPTTITHTVEGTATQNIKNFGTQQNYQEV